MTSSPSKLFFMATLLLSMSRPSWATVLYVSATATGSNDGTSWQDAFTDLQTALALSQYGDTIWVAQGTYRPTNTFDRHASFEIPNGRRLFGGFNGMEASLTERDWSQNLTVLSGDIGNANDYGDNSYTVVYLSNVDSTTVLDGFTVRDGKADSNLPSEPFNSRTKSGGGLYVTSTLQGFRTEPVVRNCRFFANEAVGQGGGAKVLNPANMVVNPLFINCIFDSNSATFGGGVHLENGNNGKNLEFRNCSFDFNSAFLGAGLYYYNLIGSHEVVMDSCTFYFNFAFSSGGGIYYENSNLDHGGLYPKDCEFIENSADGDGSAFLYLNFVPGAPTIRMDRIKFKGNVNGQEAVIYFDEATVVLNQCIFEDNMSVGSGCVALINSKLLATNCIFIGSRSLQNYILSGYSPALIGNEFVIVNCSFMGNYGALGLLAASDTTTIVHIENSVFFNNQPTPDGKLLQLSNFDTANFRMSHSLVDVAGCNTLANIPLTCGPGMRYNLDPMFLDTAAGDFRLHPCSPARNAGSNAAVDSLGLPADLAGQPRIQGGTVDMGAHESPAFHAATAIQLAPACGSAPGTISIELQHGCPPYFLDWGSGTAIADASPAVMSLPAGQYGLTVTDGRMEADTIALEVTASPAISLGLSVAPVQCSNATGGMATVTPAGGTGPFTYLWANGDSTATVAGLPVGSYPVTVTDAAGCTAIASADITAEGQLQVGLGVMPISCHPANGPSGDGSATVQPIGGTGPYVWLWGNGATTPTLDSIGAGAYSATVTDALGCTGSTSFSMDGPTELLASIEANQPACHGDPGTGMASAIGGTPGYNYQWDNGAMTPAASLPPGPHTVTVTDAKGCTDTAAIDITEPPLLTATASPVPPMLCHGASDGTLEVVPMGGASPYSWTGSTQGLPPGDYNLTVTDANGCTATATATLAEHPPITVTDTITDASSPTASDGAIEVIGVAGGAGAPYAFGWGTSDTTQSINGLASGSYALTVTDPQGCTAGFVFTVGSASAAGGAGGHRFGAAIVPNPSGSSGAALRLERSVPGLRARVLDAKGGLVAELGAIAATTFELPKGLSAGSYTVALEAEGGRALLVWVVVE